MRQGPHQEAQKSRRTGTGGSEHFLLKIILRNGQNRHTIPNLSYHVLEEAHARMALRQEPLRLLYPENRLIAIILVEIDGNRQIVRIM